MSDKIFPVLLGGAITLVVTLLVQIFVQAYVIPRVQIRNRARERWENDVIDMVAVIEEKLPGAISAYRTASGGSKIAKQSRQQYGTDQQPLEELFASWAAEQREAGTALHDQMFRLDVLDRRIRRLNPDALYWKSLVDQRRRLRVALIQVEISWLDGDAIPTDEEWDAAWANVSVHREGLLAIVRQIADPTPQPPHQGRFRWVAARWRTVSSAVSRLKASRRIRRQRQEITPSCSGSDRSRQGVQQRSTATDPSESGQTGPSQSP